MSAHRDVLVRARDILAERGWTQKHLCDARGVCSLEALGRACRELGHDDWGPVYDKARTALAMAIGTPKVISWNDSTERRREQVLAAFARAAMEAA